MGANGSKNASTAASSKPTPWLLEEEVKAINKEFSLMANKENIWDTTLGSCSEGGEKLSDLYFTLLSKWPQRFTAKEVANTTKFSIPQLLPTIMEILNPDPSVQADALALLAGNSEAGVPSTNLMEVVIEMIDSYCCLPDMGPDISFLYSDKGCTGRVAREWLHTLLFGDASHKKTTSMEVPNTVISREALERWLQGHAAVYAVVQLTVLRFLVLPTMTLPPYLFPEVVCPTNMNPSLSKPEMLLLNTALPQQLRCQWRLLFANHLHGNSFSLFMKQIVGAGPSLVVVEDGEGNKFGGFASASWEVRPQFHGTAESFLFSLRPQAGVYRTTGYNSNFQYLNYLENNTMPNGLGMGGREELFGFFLSSDFGECTVAPSCTTYASPAFCSNPTPRVRRLFVWGVGEEPKDSDDDSDEGNRGKKPSALDRNPEARAMLDMIGRTRASEGIREPEQQ